MNGKLDDWINEWSLNLKNSDLTFEEYVSDPMRWATGGDTKKKHITLRGEVVEGQNKWFWALSGLANGENLYQTSLVEGNNAQVALVRVSDTLFINKS